MRDGFDEAEEELRAAHTPEAVQEAGAAERRAMLKEQAKLDHERREAMRRGVARKRGKAFEKGKKTRAKGPGSFRQKDTQRN